MTAMNARVGSSTLQDYLFDMVKRFYKVNIPNSRMLDLQTSMFSELANQMFEQKCACVHMTILEFVYSRKNRKKKTLIQTAIGNNHGVLNTIRIE